MEQFLLDEQVDELAVVLHNLETRMVEKQRLERELDKIRKINTSNEGILWRTQARFMAELDKMRERIAGVDELLEKHKKKRNDLLKPDPKEQEVEYQMMMSGNLEERYLEEKRRNEENERKLEEMMKELGSSERIRRTENGPPACGVCDTAYAEREPRTPRVLACGHTICEACALKLVDGSAISCPMCRQKTPLVDKAVSRLPKNLALLEWIEKTTV